MQRFLSRLHLPSTSLRSSTTTTLTTARPFHHSTRLLSAGPNGEPNKAASETTGTSGANDPKQGHSAQKRQGEQQFGSEEHPAKQPDVQEQPTRTTGILGGESGPDEGKKGGFGKEKR